MNQAANRQHRSPGCCKGISRRALLVAAGQIPLMAMGQGVSVDSEFWNRPRRLHLVRGGEWARVTYFADGQLVPEGYQACCYLLRDVQANVVGAMDIRLLDALCGAQGYLSAFGIDVPWEATSGLRTARTNATTEGAVRDSEHLYGRATDGRFPGIPSDKQAALARMYATGGLGWYPARNFCHLDVGRFRSWLGT